MSTIYVFLDDVLSDRPGYVEVANTNYSYRADLLPPPGKIDQLVVFTPGTDVSIYRVQLPARSQAEALRAAAYAIEDDLAQPADTVHTALSPRIGTDNSRDVHVTDRALMAHWVEALEARGLSMAQLVAETSVLPTAPSAMELKDRILFSVDGKAFAIDNDFPDEAVQAYANLASAPLEVVGETLAERLGHTRVAAVSDRAPLIALTELAELSSSLVNLRQGEFSPRRKIKIDLKDWKVPIGLAAAVCLAWVATTGIETWSLNRSTKYMNAEAVRLYQSYFPNEPVPARPVAAISEKLGGTTERDIPLLHISAMMYEATAKIDGARITSLRYDANVSRLNVGLTFRNYGDDVLIKNALEERNLTVSLGSSRSNGQTVSGDLTVDLST